LYHISTAQLVEPLSQKLYRQYFQVFNTD